MAGCQDSEEKKDTAEGGLEVIAALSAEVVCRPDQGIFSGRLLESSRRARRCLPDAQKNLESALDGYRRALDERSRPFSPSAILSRLGRMMGLVKDTSMDDLYLLQSRCFGYLLEIVDDIASEAAFHESGIRVQRDELADWLERAGPAIAQARRELRDRSIASGGYSLTKRVQHSHLLRSFRSDVRGIEQVEILYRSRQDLLPALETYARVAEDISHAVLTLKAHAIAAAEYFERTFEPARFLDQAAEVMPCLEQGVRDMQDYHSALSQSIAVCVDRLGSLTDRMGLLRRR